MTATRRHFEVPSAPEGAWRDRGRTVITSGRPVRSTRRSAHLTRRGANGGTLVRPAGAGLGMTRRLFFGGAAAMLVAASLAAQGDTPPGDAARLLNGTID